MATHNVQLTPSTGFYSDFITEDVDGRKWFAEKEAMWPGQKMCIEIDEILEEGRSKFQDILVFKSKTYGIVLVLDGVIQYTERDEMSYQEMITHLPIFAHPNPRKVLIVGGGDGGVLREVAKHKDIEVIHMCEIDEQVCEVSKKYSSTTLANSFNDPRLTLMIDDAAKYLSEEGSKQQYDVIICDSSDPVGPAEVLFEAPFFKSMNNALNPNGGVLCTQGECMWLHLDLIEKVVKRTKDIMPVVKYAYTTVPTYPSGQIGFIIASNNEKFLLNQPAKSTPSDMELKYYSTPLHSSAFVLPAFAESKLNNTNA
jgi:spermidine synthase